MCSISHYFFITLYLQPIFAFFNIFLNFFICDFFTLNVIVLQPLKAFFLIFKDFALSITIVDNFLQFLKAFALIVFTLEVIVTFFSFLQPLKAFAEMVVTFTFLPPMVTVFGTLYDLIVVAFFTFVNAAAELEVALNVTFETVLVFPVTEDGFSVGFGVALGVVGDGVALGVGVGVSSSDELHVSFSAAPETLLAGFIVS